MKRKDYIVENNSLEDINDILTQLEQDGSHASNRIIYTTLIKLARHNVNAMLSLPIFPTIIKGWADVMSHRLTDFYLDLINLCSAEEAAKIGNYLNSHAIETLARRAFYAMYCPVTKRLKILQPLLDQDPEAAVKVINRFFGGHMYPPKKLDIVARAIPQIDKALWPKLRRNHLWYIWNYRKLFVNSLDNNNEKRALTYTIFKDIRPVLFSKKESLSTKTPALKENKSIEDMDAIEYYSEGAQTKRKDYITEEKSSIEHIDELMQSILDNLAPDPTAGHNSDELCRYLTQVPGKLWNQVPSIDSYMKKLAATNMYQLVRIYRRISEHKSPYHKWRDQTFKDEMIQNGIMPYIRQLSGYKLGEFMATACYWAGKIPDESLWTKVIQDPKALNEFATIIGGGDYEYYRAFEYVPVPDEVLSKFPHDIMGDIIYDLEADNMKNYIYAWRDITYVEEWNKFTEKLKIFTRTLDLNDPPTHDDMVAIYNNRY
jgi:hypothetical protein